MLIRVPWYPSFPWSEATPERLYVSRRSFMAGTAAALLALQQRLVQG